MFDSLGLGISMIDTQAHVAVLHGDIGSGKTTTCLELARRAANRGIPVYGLLEIRAIRGSMLLGYDMVNVECNEAFAFARLKEQFTGTDWLQYPNLRYAFSQEGIERANKILQNIADRQPERSLVILDEYGRLEKEGEGIHQGIIRIAEKPPRGLIMCTCRTDLAEIVTDVFRPHAASIKTYTPLAAESLWRLCTRILLPEVDLK